MLSLIEEDFVNKKNWLTKAELANIFAIAECTPGPIAINCATFIGIKRLGFLGGIVATIGVVLPSFAIMVALSYIINLVRDNKWIEVIFKGVRVGVIVVIFRAIITFYKSIKKNLFSFAMIIVAFCLVFLTKVSVVYVILGSIVVSSIFIAVVSYHNNHKLHMFGTPEYYSELTGKHVAEDEYFSEQAEREDLIKIYKEDIK